MFARSMCTIVSAAIIGLTLALSPAAQGVADAQASYTIVDLGVSTPRAINRNGQVTGNRRFSPNHVADHAFRWNPASPNIFVDLGLPSGYKAGVGYGLNSQGDVAGNASSPSGPSIGNHAVLWPAVGALQFIGPTKNSDLTSASAINDSKDVVGGRAAGAFLSKIVNGNRSLYTIGPGAARAINTSGKILGYGNGSGYVWTPSGAPGVGTTSSLPSGYSAISLNDLGALAGERPYFVVAPWGPFDSVKPVVYFAGGPLGDGASWLDIPWPAAVEGYEWIWGGAHAINSSGVVVGASARVDPDGYDTYATWIWDAVNGTRNLDDLIPSGTGWTLFNLNGPPTTINDNGWIAGTGTLNGQKRGFVLIPN